jgi:hypothetical protein
MVKVHLTSTYGYQDNYYNPKEGGTEVPEGLALSLGLRPIGEDTPGEEPAVVDSPGSTFHGLKTTQVAALKERGFGTKRKLLKSTDEELLAVPGMDQEALDQLRANITA